MDLATNSLIYTCNFKRSCERTKIWFAKPIWPQRTQLPPKWWKYPLQQMSHNKLCVTFTDGAHWWCYNCSKNLMKRILHRNTVHWEQRMRPCLQDAFALIPLIEWKRLLSSDECSDCVFAVKSRSLLSPFFHLFIERKIDVSRWFSRAHSLL